MTARIATTIKKFNAYQRERFPLVVLILSLIPAVLSSGIVVSLHPTIFQTCSALAASVAYLLHIRIIDEHRDFGHDNAHHVTRPIQTGVISKEELQYVDIAAVVLLLLIAVTAGLYGVAIAAIMLIYSYLAGREFFIGEKIRQYFFIYNGVNLIQMLLMQLFVYTIFAHPFPISILVLAHFLFTTVGTVIFEFVRKIKRPGWDGTGKDTYTWYIGFNNAIITYIVLLSSNALLFFWIIALISSHATLWLFSSAGLAVATLSVAIVHRVKKTHQTDQLMQLSFLVLYGFFNIAIYFLKLYA